MTVVVSIVRLSSVVMANDSAVSLTFSDHAEYETGPKAWLLAARQISPLS